ncbi:MAG: hypothetical protein ABEL76_16965, partial [Bradymonadaceae bacterium]
RSPRSEASRRAEEPKRTGDGGSREGGDRRRTELTLQVESARVYRGEPVQLQGQLVAGRSARPVEGATVEVRIGRHGAPVEQMSKLGQTSTDASGRYSLTVEVPKTLEIGRWSLVAYYAGDERLAPSEAR